MEVNIAGKIIGENHPAFIIAELSCNHQQNFELALDTIRAIKESGADAVKLSTDLNDGGITIDCDNEFFRIGHESLWGGKTLYELYQEAFTPWEWQPKLKKFAEELGLVCFSTATDPTAVDFLEEMNVPAYKVASFEINDLPLISYIAAKQKPVIISTGIASLGDIAEAVDACRLAGNNQIALLKAVSSYPTPLEQINLRTIPHLAETFGTVVGLSDHSLSTSVAVASVALGARIIEKHFILDRKLGGPDASFSIEPHEFREMVVAVREVEKSLGKICYDPSEEVEKNKIFARSLFVIRDIAEGERFSIENIRSIRPGYGLPPKHLSEILGKKARTRISRGTPVAWDLIQ